MTRNLYGVTLKQSENLLPAEFYDVRQETTPKAGWIPMYAFAGFAYIGAIIAFAIIFTTEASKSTTETLISTSDRTGHDGYTCSMISKVTASYEVASSSGFDPVQAFQLINVIESRSEYEASYALTSPCAQPLQFFLGGVNPVLRDDEATYGAGVFYGNDVAYYLASTAQGSTLLRLNITGGLLSQYAINVLTESIAVDANGNPYSLYGDGEGNYEIYRLTPNSNKVFYTKVVVYTATLPIQPIILNDNLYNVYLAEHDTFTALDVYSDSTATNTTLFSTRAGEYITHAAVYNSGSALKVYYINNTQDATVWEDGVFTTLGSQPLCVGITVDASDNLFYLFDLEDALVLTDSQDSVLTLIYTASEATGLAVMVTGARAMIIEAKRGMSFVYDPTATSSYYNTELVLAHSGFSVGYFTCGSALLNSTQYETFDDTAYTTVCQENGVIGQVAYENTYMLTTTDAETYAYLHGPSHCAALSEPIAETIADLPPYSCSRTIHPSFLACFATAAANTQLLFQVLVFLSALALSRLAARFPPPKQSVRSATAPAAAPASIEMSNISTFAGNGAYVSDVENPMT